MNAEVYYLHYSHYNALPTLLMIPRVIQVYALPTAAALACDGRRWAEAGGQIMLRILCV
jgi:hypothetical protein